MYLSILAVGIGGALGSLFRWFLGIRLNGVFPALPLGTLASNVIAGYVIGIAVAYFGRNPNIAPEWRLFVITGLMGGLSTFSTFSAEVVQHLQEGRLSTGRRAKLPFTCRLPSSRRCWDSRRSLWLRDKRRQSEATFSDV